MREPRENDTPVEKVAAMGGGWWVVSGGRKRKPYVRREGRRDGESSQVIGSIIIEAGGAYGIQGRGPPD
jgi:hypothetical protein